MKLFDGDDYVKNDEVVDALEKKTKKKLKDWAEDDKDAVSIPDELKERL